MKNMLTFSPRLYVGEGINIKKLDKIKSKLIHKPLTANVYVLTYAHNPVDQLEFFDARQLFQHYYQENSLIVVGIAQDYEDALELVETITKECIQARGDCNLKEYLIC